MHTKNKNDGCVQRICQLYIFLFQKQNYILTNIVALPVFGDTQNVRGVKLQYSIYGNTCMYTWTHAEFPKNKVRQSTILQGGRTCIQERMPINRFKNDSWTQTRKSKITKIKENSWLKNSNISNK